jgi:hypothetical protein
MSSTSNKQYTPTAVARPNWREREAQKERQQREAARMAIEEAQRKKIAKTEENFPTTMGAAKQMRVHGGPAGKFAELAQKWQVDEELERKIEEYRNARDERKRSDVLNTIVFLRRRREEVDNGYDDEEDYESHTPPYYDDQPSPAELNEKFPAHGRRGTYTEPDAEGWRMVIKRTRKQPRELTEAELVQKYRREFFGENTGEDGDDDMNGDLTDRNQRREFY